MSLSDAIRTALESVTLSEMARPFPGPSLARIATIERREGAGPT